MNRRGANIAVIMVGGSGTRLWPLSRADRPKPFLPLVGGEELFGLTLKRIAAASRHVRFDRVLIVGAAAQLPLLAPRLSGFGLPVEILAEPQPRNTAAAIAAAGVRAAAEDPSCTLFVFAADHAIGDAEAFGRDLVAARTLAAHGRIVCFGIPPTGPNTGYGYIETADARSEEVIRFTEKPDAATASRWIAGGKHLWNSGMFVFRADVILAEFAEHAPEILAAAKGAVGQAAADGNILRLAPAPWLASPDIAVDRAIMEKSAKVAVVRASFAWSDLGSWDQIAAENRDTASGQTLHLDSGNVHVTQSRRLVVTIGLNDVVVADTPDVLLVAALARSQDVANALAQARAVDPALATTTDTAHGLLALRRVNRRRARSVVEDGVAMPGFAEAAASQFLPADTGASRAAERLRRALRGDLDPKGARRAAGEFLAQDYDAENWRPRRDATAGPGQTAFRYAWAAALAALYSDRREEASEIARKLAAAAETSAIDAASGLAWRELPAAADACFDLETQCWRLRALTALGAAGFHEFSRNIEEAAAGLLDLLSAPERKDAPDTLAAIAALRAYLDLGVRPLR